MNSIKQIILSVAAVLLAVVLIQVAIIVVIDMNSPHESGKLWYEPIDKLPEGKFAVVLTEEDFVSHPALVIIFDEENPERSIPSVYDTEREGNPEPHISEGEGYTIMYEYPYVEYEGQLYECVWVLA